MVSGIAAMSIDGVIALDIITSAAEGTAIGAVRKPKIARIESRGAIRDQSLIATRHDILCTTAKDGVCSRFRQIAATSHDFGSVL
ncbi:hypothetical protein C9417_00080 [Rhizobium sp. SEMIA 4088]|nr:hypothetical protein C9417_00080 [Rhizobium sp. SEMIA 4088]